MSLKPGADPSRVEIEEASQAPEHHYRRLNHRDGKPGYLQDIPRTLGYVREVAARYPELAFLRDLLQRDGLREDG